MTSASTTLENAQRLALRENRNGAAPTLSSLYLTSCSAKPPLRIGILLDGDRLIRIFSDVLVDILQSNFAEVDLLVYNCSAATAEPATPRALPLRIMRRLSKPHRKTLMWELYTRLDRRLYSVADDPLAEEDCSELLHGIDAIHISPITSRFVHRFPEEALEAIRSRHLDVILRFGFNILRGGILQAARYGVWSFHHGDPDFYRGGPAQFWELYEQNPLSGVVLQVLNEELDAGCMLAKTLFATMPGISLGNNRMQPYFGSQHLVIQKLWELHQYGWECVRRKTVPLAPYQGRQKPYRTPKNWQLARWLVPRLAGRLVSRVARGIAGEAHIDHWRVAVRGGSQCIQGPGRRAHMSGFHWIESAHGHYYADPFLIEKEGRSWLFFEDYTYQQRRGVIACAEVSPDGRLGVVREVLDTGQHASYPYVFEVGGAVYMVPETASDRATYLFRATRFPLEWKREATLLARPSLDPSLCWHDGKWWMFVSLRDPRGLGLMLYLFYASALAGPWRYHPANPISSDVRNIRGAGRIFHQNGCLIRPTQDCSHRYGYGFTLYRIVRLTPEEYREEPLLKVAPNWENGLLATHTYNRTGSLEVIDGQVSRRRREVM